VHRSIAPTKKVFRLSLACVAALVSSTVQAQSNGPPEGLSASDWSGIREAYAAGRHTARPVEDGYRAENPGQRWSTHFDGRGFTTRPETGGWTWGLELERYGFAGREREVARTAGVTASSGRVAYDWDDTLREWYVNDTRGLEHGYTVHRRPPRDEDAQDPGPLRFTLAVRGELVPVLQADGHGVRFVDGRGGTVLTYAGLTVFDADGRTLPARFEPALEGLVLSVDERGARYPLTIDPTAQQAYLKASNAEGGSNIFGGDWFGRAVAVSGDTVVVGAQQEDSDATGVNGPMGNANGIIKTFNGGAAYVFVRNGSTWSQQAYLKASNTDELDAFGFSVAISGDTIVVGAIGEDSGANGVNGNQNGNGVPSAGAAYVFRRSGTTWGQEAYLKASNSNAGDAFGVSVGVSGDTIVVGAYFEDSGSTGVNGFQGDDSATHAGAAYVYERSGTTWTWKAYLKASNTGEEDLFGLSVAISGDTIVVGAGSEDSDAVGVDGDGGNDDAPDAGAAYVFARSGGTWSQEAYLKASNADADDAFGRAVSVSGDTIVVGANREASAATSVNGDQSDDSAPGAGAAYVFTRSGGTWSQEAYLKASNAEGSLDAFGGDNFGIAASVSGDCLVVGAFTEDSAATGVNGDQDDNSALSAGAAYVFARSGTTWSQLEYLKASNTLAGDVFGLAVGISDLTVVAGAPFEDGTGTGVVNARRPPPEPDDDLASGAAYVFLVEAPECYLVLGKSTLPGSFAELGHTFSTQVSGITSAYAVLMESIPSFAWPVTSPKKKKTAQVPATAVAEFNAQVLMWNPTVFPSNPEQYSEGLDVTLWSNGRATARRYGSKDGITIQMETYVANGTRYVRFPFSIDGF
jgi:hypothetical protein